MPEEKSLAEQLFDVFMRAKKLAIESNDFKYYEEFMLESLQGFSKDHDNAKTDAGRSLYLTLIDTCQKELVWAKKKQKEQNIPF